MKVTSLELHIRANHPKKNAEEWWPLHQTPGDFFSPEAGIS